MLSLHSRLSRAALPVLLIGISAAYPIIVFVANAKVPPLAFAAGACALLGLRALSGSSHWSGAIRYPLLAAIALIAGLALLDDTVAAKAYPAVLSCGFAI